MNALLENNNEPVNGLYEKTSVWNADIASKTSKAGN
jgi:hypothetical protein